MHKKTILLITLFDCLGSQSKHLKQLIAIRLAIRPIKTSLFPVPTHLIIAIELLPSLKPPINNNIPLQSK